MKHRVWDIGLVVAIVVASIGCYFIVANTLLPPSEFHLALTAVVAFASVVGVAAAYALAALDNWIGEDAHGDRG